MQNAIRVLKELASVNLHYAMADIETQDDRDSIAHALNHVQEVEACLRIILNEMNGAEDDPTPAPI